MTRGVEDTGALSRTFDQLLAAVERGADVAAEKKALLHASAEHGRTRGRLLVAGMREVSRSAIERALTLIDRSYDAETILSALGLVSGGEDVEQVASRLLRGASTSPTLLALAAIGGPHAAAALSRFAGTGAELELRLRALRMLDRLACAETSGPSFPAAPDDFVELVRASARASAGRSNDSPLASVLRNLGTLVDRGADDSVRMTARNALDAIAAVCGRTLLIEARNRAERPVRPNRASPAMLGSLTSAAAAT